MWANGKMGNSMGREWSLRKIIKSKKENGLLAKGFDGSRIPLQQVDLGQMEIYLSVRTMELSLY